MSRTLPPRPSLEQLRKQAKDLLKAHKAGSPDACQALRLLRRFKHAGDADILSASVRLADCQFALAMEYGFSDWRQLRDHVDLTERARRHLGHWQRFGGDEGEKVRMVLQDAEWASLLRTEEELTPLSEEAKSIRERIACMEPCHTSYGTNVQRVLEMISSMQPGPIFDCGQTDEDRQARARSYRGALLSWLASVGGDESGQLPDVARYLGKPNETKRVLVGHLIRKLEDNAYRAHPDGQEDFSKTESRITYLEVCCHYWEQSTRVLLQEIGAGKRLVGWHKPDGFNACGDTPDRVAQLGELLGSARAWLDGDADGAGRVGHILGERTPQKCWLLASLCKHIRSVAQQGHVVS